MWKIDSEKVRKGLYTGSGLRRTESMGIYIWNTDKNVLFLWIFVHAFLYLKKILSTWEFSSHARQTPRDFNIIIIIPLQSLKQSLQPWQIC